MELIDCAVVFWTILHCTTSFGGINAEECWSPRNDSDFVGTIEANGYANLFRTKVSIDLDKVCVAFSAVRDGNIWNITMNYAAKDSDVIGSYLDGFEQFSAFGLRDSSFINIEPCNETARFGFEEAGVGETCSDYEGNSKHSVNISLRVAFKMAAIPKELSSWYDKGRMFGPSMRNFQRKGRRKTRRNDSGAKSSFGSVFGLWAFCTVLIVVEFKNWNIF